MEIACDQCGYRFEVPEQSAGLSAECPHCQAEIAPRPAHLEPPMALDEDAAPPPAIRTVLGEPPPVLSEEAAREQKLYLQGLFGGYRRIADFHSPIVRPDVSFPRDVLRSLRVVFWGRNARVAFSVLYISAAMRVAWLLMLLGLKGPDVFGAPEATLFAPFLLAAGVILFPPALFWLCAIMYRTGEAAIAGDDDMPLKVWTGGGRYEDFVLPAVRLLGTWWLALMPLWLYWIVLHVAKVPHPPREVDLALALLGLFLWPGAVFLVTLGNSLNALLPQNLLRIVLGAPQAYLSLWLALACVLGLGAWITVQVVDPHSLDIPWIVFALFGFTSVFAMRVIGLMYRHFKDKLPFAAE